MSLLEESMDECVILNKVTEKDGYGGYKTSYTEGADFDAAIVLDTSIEARRAEREGVKSLYTVTTSKVLNLQYHDVFKRVKDNAIFRVTSNGDDKKTPPSATLDMRQVTAEKWEIPTDE